MTSIWTSLILFFVVELMWHYFFPRFKLVILLGHFLIKLQSPKSNESQKKMPIHGIGETEKEEQNAS